MTLQKSSVRPQLCRPAERLKLSTNCEWGEHREV
jgi:hypothetical protein